MGPPRARRGDRGAVPRRAQAANRELGLSGPEPPPLTLAPEKLRRLGYRVVDLIVERAGDLRSRPPVHTGTRAELDAVLREPPPEAPGDVDAALDTLAHVVLAHMQAGDHPRYFARVPGPSNPVGALADALGAGFNVIATSWSGSSGPAALELVVLDWLRELCGLPPGGDGILLSGGSASSLSALAAAREAKIGGHDADAVVYVSDQTHASVLRALRILGFGRERVRVLESDAAFRLRAAEVAGAIAADRAGGLRPFCVVATSGTTNTGAVDPLPELADVARDAGLWLHVDGAYGAPAALTARGRALLTGLEHADSLALDPHKWLFQPYEAGCLLMRDAGMLARTFHMAPEYLRDVLAAGAEDEVDFRDRGPQLTRFSRALKLWLSLKTFGAAAFRDAIDHTIALAEHAEQTLRATPGWEVVTPAQLAVVTFAHDRADAGELVAAAVRDGFAAPSSTVLRGRTVVRLCTINPRTTFDDIDATIARLTQLACG